MLPHSTVCIFVSFDRDLMDLKFSELEIKKQKKRHWGLCSAKQWALWPSCCLALSWCYQPEVIQPAPASTLALKVLSGPMAAFAKEVSNPVPCVCVGVYRGAGGCKNIRNVWVVCICDMWRVCMHEFIRVVSVVGGGFTYAWMEASHIFLLSV